MASNSNRDTLEMSKFEIADGGVLQVIIRTEDVELTGEQAAELLTIRDNAAKQAREALGR